VINGVNVTANANVKSSVRGLQASVDLVENSDQDTIPGLFLGYETLAPGAGNGMTVTLAFEPEGGDRVFTYSWSYTLYYGNTGGLSSNIPGLSSQALDSLVAHFDGKLGVQTDGESVVSWTPVDGNGDFLDDMIVQSTQRGGGAPELITYDGSGKLTFDDTDVGADGRYLGGTLSNAESQDLTVFWVGNYSADAPFATSGTYVYNIGINSTSHQRDDGAGGFVVEQYNGTTYAGDDITAYDGVTTVWSTVLTADSHAFYANGTNLNVGGTPSNNVKANASMIIGAYSSSGYDFVGEVEQLIVFGSALSDADRKLVEDYLAGNKSGSSSNVAKMAVNQIFQRGDDLYVIWPGSPGLVLERNSDCKGGTWETIPSTVGKGIHVEKNCGTKAFFRLVRVRE